MTTPTWERLQIGSLQVDPHRLFFIAGPCVVESEELTLDIAREIARISREDRHPIIFKASFDKANRTSVDSYRGPGMREGLRILSRVKSETGLPVISDIHTPDQAAMAAEVLDALQIPAFLSRQTDLLVAAARTGKAINLKKGQFQSPDDVIHGLNKIRSAGAENIMLTERGAAFGYNDLVADMRSIVRMKRHGRPIVFDATHSAQFPGKSGGKSGGDRSLVPALARAGVAAGADAIFIETHPDPDRALCDGPNSLALKNLRVLLASLAGIHDLINQADPPRESDSPPLPARPTELILSKEDKFRRVKLIVFDVDGVLTDGGIFLGSNEIEIKYFHVRDGHGIKIAIRSGLEVAFITGRKSEAVTRRAKELGISHVYQGVRDKVPAFTELASALGVSHEEIAVVGDDIVDIPIMRRAGVSFTVPEAPDEVRRVADVVVDVPGGRGAARKVIETVLRAQGKWDLVMERYFA